jgi:hypothetical protein
MSPLDNIKNFIENQVNIKIDDEDEINKLKKNLSRHVDVNKQLIGLSFFTLIFIVLIPYLLFTYKYFGILEGYIPNVDMIATVLSFQREPFLHFKSYLEYLYKVDTDTAYGYFSQTFINYMALLGLTFFIAYYTYQSKSLFKGWSRAFIMLPLTYLLPGGFINYYMKKASHYLDSSSSLKNVYIKDLMVYGIGILTILFFILSEKFLINLLGNKIANFLSKYLN